MNLLITGAWKHADENIDEIEKMGHKVIFLQQEKDSLPCPYEWVEGVICNGLFLYHNIKKFKNLKFIQLTSAGFDRVPIDYVNENGIEIYNAKGVYSIPMAEYAIASTLYIYKHIEFFRNNQKNSIWEKNRNIIELNEKKVCILGCGNVGIECAKRFKAFNCQITGISDIPINSLYFDEIYDTSSLKSIIMDQDIIITSLPLTKETYHLIDSDVLEYVKSSAIIINFSRGTIIDTNALMKRLEKKDIYVVLDVFEEEPLQTENPLWNNENVIITPHNSFVGDKNDVRLRKVIINNLMRFGGFFLE